MAQPRSLLPILLSAVGNNPQPLRLADGGWPMMFPAKIPPRVALLHLSGREYDVLVAIARHANRDGFAWPSLATIVAEAGTREKRVPGPVGDRRGRRPASDRRSLSLAPDFVQDDAPLDRCRLCAAEDQSWGTATYSGAAQSTNDFASWKHLPHMRRRGHRGAQPAGADPGDLQ
jgi:hypothetical protein